MLKKFKQAKKILGSPKEKGVSVDKLGSQSLKSENHK